ncbi:LacI family DNA-binding transcriptional regulator [Pelagicoccus mobilis]|uniref:LacI family DNA-binding transcriptional regulator n=1 Tax=Pelagicoccus mobilis TaxID=415221 RepID=A0A934VSN3_9BACT|nr:LacI family DNA-binding transcriptional regulator [Pelagicoccus mobilis]MBK1879185.1 LacI family DNA-binding transcriptional regulator [Pelagicoccus mobilis]
MPPKREKSGQSKPTISDIAEKVGVSKATVSRALRGLPGQSEEMRLKIEQAARDLGYIKNPLVAALMTDLRFKKTAGYAPVLAYVHCLPWGTPLHPNMLVLRDAAISHAQGLGYAVEEFHLNEPGMNRERLLSIFKARGIRGVVFEHFFEGNVNLDVDLQEFASVAIGLTLKSPDLHRVVVDQYSSLFIAAQHLGEMGYRRIGVVIPRLRESFSHFKREAALHVLHQRCAEEDRIPICLLDDKQDTHIVMQWLRRFKPDVLLGTNSELLDFLESAGYKVPEDLGFVNLAWHEKDRECAGIRPNWDRAGIAAVNQVVDQLNRAEFGVPEYPLKSFIGGTWVEGATVRQRT